MTTHPNSPLPLLSHQELVQLRRAAEDAIEAANPRYGPFVDAFANPRKMLALLDLAMQGGAPEQADAPSEKFERRDDPQAEKVEALLAKLADAEVYGPKTSMTDAQAFEWAWAELKKELGAERWNVGEEVQSWAFFKYGWDNRTQLELQRYRAPVTSTTSLPAPNYWMSIQHGKLNVSYTDDSDSAYKWFPVWTWPLARASELD